MVGLRDLPAVEMTKRETIETAVEQRPLPLAVILSFAILSLLKITRQGMDKVIVHMFQALNSFSS